MRSIVLAPSGWHELLCMSLSRASSDACILFARITLAWLGLCAHLLRCLPCPSVLVYQITSRRHYGIDAFDAVYDVKFVLWNYQL